MLLASLSSFRGKYSDYDNTQEPCCTGKRPFYVWLVGPADQVEALASLLPKEGVRFQQEIAFNPVKIHPPVLVLEKLGRVGPVYRSRRRELVHGNQAPVFRDSLYDKAGVWLLLLTLLGMVFFYYGLGSARARYARVSYWLLTGALTAMVCILSAMVVVHLTDGLGMFDTASLSFYLVDGVYALLLFALLSVLFKWWSPNARRTPF